MGDGRPVPWCTTTYSGEQAEHEGGLCHSHGMVTGEASGKMPTSRPFASVLDATSSCSSADTSCPTSRATCLDVPVVVQYGKEEDHRHSRMYPADSVMDIPPAVRWEQPVPRSPVDVTRFMFVTDRGDDVWWLERLQEWYDGWRRRRTPKVMVTVHGGDLCGSQQYYKWFARVARHGRFLSRAGDLADPRWNLALLDISSAAVHPRDELVMPNNAPAPRRRGGHKPRPRQAAPARGKLSLQDQHRRTRMLVVGAAAHLEEERAEDQREYDQQDESS
ncbi:hypothetical protein PIB30_066579 [Stylosanthes scabra]|uniref:Uncharacterized protein n=1 Tax=Stylosanthes scabra TaxID=79078 RepID=A0ABU6UNC9_9FABA|nr:hypothetical protein [Stylosanthes scabra]